MIHSIPTSALQQHIAVLGKTGSGKTYAIRGTVELILDRSERVCIIDPTGAWHGLRSSATGKSAGYPIAIFGGDHSDLALSGTHGEAMAQVVGTVSTPTIIDTSLMRVGERTRFFTDFADGLMRYNKGPLHLVIDEAHLFAPQGKVNDPQSGAMLHAANNLVSGGRSRGLRIILITQRPAKLHKDSLSQIETLIAMRLIAPQDRKAVEEWIKDNADQVKGREILESLATLKTGQGWLWAPEISLLDRISFPKIKTFDSGRAPDGTETAGQVLAPIDIEAITVKLRVVEKEVLANDPKRLKMRVAELERALHAVQSRPPELTATETSAIQEAAERRGYVRGFTEARDKLVAIMAVFRNDLHTAVHDLASYPTPELIPIKTPVLTRQKPAPMEVLKPKRYDRPAPKVYDKPRTVEAIAKGEALVLAACIQYPEGLDRNHITVLTGYKKSTRDAYIQRLREKGLVAIDDYRVVATAAGREAHPDAEPLPTGSALRDYWLARLPEGERKVLECAMNAYPNGIHREDISSQTGYKKSTRDAYVQRLRLRQLVSDKGGGRISASETLF